MMVPMTAGKMAGKMAGEMVAEMAGQKVEMMAAWLVG